MTLIASAASEIVPIAIFDLVKVPVRCHYIWTDPTSQVHRGSNSVRYSRPPVLQIWQSLQSELCGVVHPAGRSVFEWE